METQIMYLSKTTPETTIILECTPEVLQQLVEACARPGSKASEDACLMLLMNGKEQTGNGAKWQRVQKPLNFVPAPSRCDITGELLNSVMYDAKVNGPNGQWAIMSQNGWDRYGNGKLGTGFGQKYLRNEEGHFYLSEGMTSIPRAYKVAA